MQQTVDTIFPFKGFWDHQARCRLRVFEEEGKPTVVIATELPGNPSTSITNAAELVATQVYEWLERPANGIAWIENYLADPEAPKESRAHEESFDLVTFTATARGFVNPKWRYMTREAVERIIGQAI